MTLRLLHFTLLYSLTRKPNFRCTATSVSRKILLCFCEPSQTFTPFWRVTFSEHFLKEWSFTFFGKETSNLVDGNISIEKNVFTTQRIISCEDFGKRIVFAQELYFKSIGPHEKKKTMLKVWRCCLLKSKIKYQPSKDLKTFSSVELVFFFESTFQATLHKMEKFREVLPNIRLWPRKSFTQNCVKHCLYWPPTLWENFKTNYGDERVWLLRWYEKVKAKTFWRK